MITNKNIKPNSAVPKLLKIALIIPAAGAFLIALHFLAQHNYLLFHSLVEFYSITIAGSLFIITWHSRQYIQQDYLKIIGLAYFFIALLDLLHTLSYKGMNIFTDYDFYANQVWIATRLFESLVLLVAFSLSHWRNRLSSTALIGLFATITAAIILIIFFWKSFPTCFVPGQGQTTFKIVGEYIAITFLAVAAFMIWYKKEQVDKEVRPYLFYSALATILGEVSFSLYSDHYGISNQVGHYFKVLSFYLIYRAIIVTGMDQPYALIFKDLKETDKRLRSAKEEAEKANQVKSEFLARVSHELRTPLNSILGFLQLLRQNSSKRLDETTNQYLTNVNMSAEHLLDMVNDILDISKIQAGKMTINPAPFNLKALLQRMPALLEQLAADKNAHIKLNINIDHQGFKADEIRVKQILYNLLSNALKFTDQASSIGLNAYEKENHLILEIYDHGPGIDEADKDQLWSPFEQLEKTKEDNTKGTGLGLAITKTLVEMHGGSLEGHNIAEGGAKFVVALPGRSFDLQNPKKKENDSPAREDLKRRLKGKDILIVEDDRVNQLLMEAFMKNLQLPFRLVGSGEEAVDTVRQHPPACILMDGQLPGIDGTEAMKRIKKEHPDIPIIISTANAMAEDREHYLETGFDSYLAKPIELEKLHQTLLQLCTPDNT